MAASNTRNSFSLKFKRRPRNSPSTMGNDTTSRGLSNKPHLKRSTSLPTKWEQAPTTRKLFWFRPEDQTATQEEESCLLVGNPEFDSGATSFRVARKSQLSLTSRAALEWSRENTLPTILDDDSGYTEEDDELLGLDFIQDDGAIMPVTIS